MNTFVKIIPPVCMAEVTIIFENGSYEFMMNHVKKYFNDWHIIQMKHI